MTTASASSKEEFLGSCKKRDRYAKKSRRFAHHLFKPIDEPICSVLTIEEQFHNSLLKAIEVPSDKHLEQLFWEKQVLEISHYAKVNYDLEELMISNTFADDMYFIPDKVVVMRPQYKAGKPSTWAYVAVHELGHHVVCRGHAGSSVNRVNQIAFFDAKAMDSNSKSYQTSLFEAEVFAWHEGMKLAKAAGIHVVDADIDRVKTNCLLSYAIID